MKQPMQPIVKDSQGVARFKENAIVNHLLDAATSAGVCDMNSIACKEFSVEDREQFAQLIGYSLCGFAELSYVRDDTVDIADKFGEGGLSEAEAELHTLRGKLEKTRESVHRLATLLFQIHPDDLRE